MQPPRDPPAAVDALVAGSGRCALRWQCPPPRALRQRPPRDPPAAPAAQPPLAVSAASASAGSIFASLWHARDTVPASPKHEPDERTLCGRLLDTPCIAGRDSDTANVFGQKLDAQEPPSVQMSPENKFIVQMSPENEAVSESRPTTPRCSDLAQKHCGERAEDTRPTNGPRAAHGDQYATRTPFHASHSAQHAPLNPLNQPPAEARKNLLASRCRRQLPGSDSVQIHVRYLSDTSAFSLLAYLATNET